MHPERSSPTWSRPTARGPDAFRGFYREHYGFVWHVVGRFGVAPAEHGDAVQDTFLTAYRKLGGMHGHAPRSWLYGIARRVASNYRRSARRAATRRADMAEAGLPTHSPAVAEALGVLDRFLAGLPPRDRELFVLSEVVGMTGQEIAEATGQLPRVVYARLRLLRQSVAELAPDALGHALGRVRADGPVATDRGWFALAPLLGGAPTAAAAPVLAGLAKLGVAVAIASAGTIAVIAVTADAGPTSPAPVASSVAPAPTVSAALTSSAVPTIERATAELDDLDTMPVGSPARPVPRRPSGTTPSRSSSSPASLAADNALLQELLGALDRGDPNVALARARDHAARFPDSPQADVRAALQVDALCRLGRADEAAGIVATQPASPMVTRAIDRCESAAKTSPTPDTAGGR